MSERAIGSHRRNQHPPIREWPRQVHDGQCRTDGSEAAHARQRLFGVACAEHQITFEFEQTLYCLTKVCIVFREEDVPPMSTGHGSVSSWS